MAGKWIAATVSTAAAVVSILSVARTYGMVGTPGPSHLAIGPLAVAWVGLAPATATATSIGDTIHLAATVTNKSGSVLVGSWLQWSSDDTTVATVSQDGLVVAHSPGTTTVLLVVGRHVARSRITVKPEPRAVRFVADSGLVIPEGGYTRVRPHVVDARGYVIKGAMPVLRIADTTVATADTSGIVIASAPGQTTLEAIAGDLTTRVPVRVEAVPSSIEGVSGTEQRASAGRPLPAPVVVRVLSLRGRPIAGQPVNFTTGAAQGLVDPATVITDSAGRARTVWTLGETPGEQRLFARTEQLDSALTIVAEADPVAANLRHTLIGDAQVAVVGDTLPARIGVRVTDSTGRPLSGIPITWAASAGDSIEATAGRTDSLGESRARWMVGPKAGLHRARVQIGGTRAIPPYPLTAIARPAAPKTVTLRSGSAQRATVGSALPKPILLRVVDRFDNPVAGATVTVSPSQGSVPDSVLATDSAGNANVRWTLGTKPGAQKLVARVSGVTKPVEATATATIGRATKAAFTASTASGVAGRALATSPAVIVTDAFGNPIAGVTVTFVPVGGSVAVSKVKTDAKGRASTKWTLGAKVGVQTLRASVAGTAAKAALEAKVAAPAAAVNKKKP